ncbi:hypothetical protein C4J81_04025 [Deltaproteobacteria bacterium Smac51]|nr:hypothetical protein C4J81_04025 [Deltaproteobacteria bacterium Smac51]
MAPELHECITEEDKADFYLQPVKNCHDVVFFTHYSADFRYCPLVFSCNRFIICTVMKVFSDTFIKRA